MSPDRALRPAPEDLEIAEEIDAFSVEAGVILLGRFIALGPVTRSDTGWSVPVSDVERKLGAPPHHRMTLEMLRVDEGQERKIRKAVRVDTPALPATHALVRTRKGDSLLLLTESITAPQATAPLTEAESAAVALGLTAALSQLHAEGVYGVAFAPQSIRVVGRRVSVVGYDHVLSSGTAEEDVHRLVDLLEFLSGTSLHDLLRPTPGSALELWERVRALQERTRSEGVHLPATAPFVGRDEEIARLMEAARRARNGEASIVILRASSGMGRTRLLRRFALEVDRWMDALVLTGRFESGGPNTRGGFLEVLDTLAQQPTNLDPSELGAIAERIRTRTAPLTGMVSSLSPALSKWLGASAAPPDLHLDERFGQHAATLASAIRAIGSAERPLVLLLDDVHLAEPGTRAILRELAAQARDHYTLIVGTCDTSFEGRCIEHTDALLELEPFTRAELAELLQRALPSPLADPERDAEIVWQATRGRPVAAWTTLKSWAHQGLLDTDEDGAWALNLAPVDTTTRVVDLQARQWQTLQAHQQWIVLVAALRSGRITERWLVEVSGWNETEVRNAVQVAIDANLLLGEPDGGLRFPNNSVRQVIESSVTEEVRANAHAQIANWLDRESRASAAQRAWHRELSRPTGRDEHLANLHVKGGQELLAIYDLDRARWHFDRALDRTTAPPIRVVALEGRGDAHLLQGHPEEALDDYLAAMSHSADSAKGLEIAGRAVWGFYRKSAADAAFTLAAHALRIAGEPVPKTWIGTGWALLVAVVGIRRRSPHSTRVRQALCHLYTSMVPTLIGTKPLAGLLSILRGYRHGRGLDYGYAATSIAMSAAFLGGLRRFRSAERVLADAEAIARRAESPFGVGVVEHIRAQNLLAMGDYEAARAALKRAVSAFRQSGDFTVAVFSLAFQASYGRNNRPLVQNIEVLDEADAIARRQGNDVGRLVVQALRAWLLARVGQADPEVLTDLSEQILAPQMFSVDLVNAHAYVAMALAEVGELERARRHAHRAVEGLEAAPGTVDFALDAYVAKASTLLAIPSRSPADERSLRRTLRRLKRAGRSSPRLLAAWNLFRARFDLQEGRPGRAQKRLDWLITAAREHQQDRHVAQAHRLLASLVEATEPLRAREHRKKAQAILEALGVEPGAIREGSAPPTPTPSTPARSRPRAVTPLETVEATVVADPEPAGIAAVAPVWVEPLVKRLLPAFERALPPNVPLQVDIARDATVRCNAESLQLLVVNMVLAARDALDHHGEIHLRVRPVTLEQEDSARLPGVNADAHLLIEARAVGYNGSETISGLGVCCEITASIGGFVDVSQEADDVLILAAYLAAQATGREPETTITESAQGAMVVHGDARVRQTVVSALRDMGLQAEGIDPRLNLEARLMSGRLVFAEAEWMTEVNTAANVVALYHRGDPRPSATLALRVPFTIGELEEVVAAVERIGDDG